ncbi:MAG: GntR family transcriptional regulator [Anaerolineae bacterium]|nr:MAG: GntR family transcriptional regulator [Anaerolineae bacterium]
MLPETPTHRQLRNLVADQLRAAILEGRYRPGEWLRQERLAQELNVSQMPVREALKELAAEGLIEHVPYRGVRVIEFSAEDIEDLYAHRAFLEGRAAAYAAQRITAPELAEIEQIMRSMEQNAAPEKVTIYRQLNRQFHQAIFNASRRDYLIRALSQMWAAFPTMLIGNFAATATHPLPERDATDAAEHQAIFRALQNHQSQEAEAAMRMHILSTARHLLESLSTTTTGQKSF